MDSQKGKCTMLSKQLLLQSDLKKNGVCVKAGSLGQGREGKRGKNDGGNRWHKLTEAAKAAPGNADGFEMMLRVTEDTSQYHRLQHSLHMCHHY